MVLGNCRAGNSRENRGLILFVQPMAAAAIAPAFRHSLRMRKYLLGPSWLSVSYAGVTSLVRCLTIKKIDMRCK